MKKSLKPANLILAGLFMVLFAVPAITIAQHKINLDRLIDETQKDSDADDRLNLVWWIPTEFWQAVQQDDPTSSEEDFAQIIEMFRPYTIVLVLDGLISELGSVTYRDKADISKNLRIIDRYGDSYKPIPDASQGGDAKTMLAIMKPMLTNMLGAMGENMEFYLFEGTNSKGEVLVQPRESETFAIKLDEEIFQWRLPLGALLPSKYCPVDSEELSGAWNYCPFHGKMLKEGK